MNLGRSKGVSVLAWLVTCFLVSGESSPLEIGTKYGRVRGFTQKTVVGKNVDTFLGIPYGASTGGQSRFGPPKEAQPWDGTLDATKHSGPCYQAIGKEYKDNVLAASGEETEDCLKMNIWTPSGRSAEKLPVMVWIHPGGFSCESSTMPMYDGTILAAQEDVVVTSFDYRLSAFGFLYFDHPMAPGNVGLMDQVLGLQWVKKNIKSFGGNPERITIFGESAGGASVGFHLLLSNSLDLFKNAILQSGTATALWATSTPEKALRMSYLLAEGAGCPTQEDKKEDTIKCLQDMNSDKLLEVLLTIEDAPFKMAYVPVIDGKFLRGHPSDLLSEGKFCGEKNVLVGYTKEDGSFLLPVFAPHLETKEESVYTEEQIRHVMSYLSKHNEETSGLGLDMVKFTYTDWSSGLEDRESARQQLIHFGTDRWIGCGAIEYANKMSAKGNKVFMYRFDHILINQTSFVKLPHWAGSVHGDELPFLFGHALKNNAGEEARLAKQVMRYWANFAKQGDPNDGYLQEWPQYTTKDKLRLQIDGKALTVDKTDRLKECAFWDKIFPKIKSENDV